MNHLHDNKILILDFGSQYTQLIARRVREIGLYCEIMPADVDAHHIRDFNPNGFILSGGHESVTQEDTMRAPAFIFEMNRPILGICYGMQTMVQQLGGKVEKAKAAEFGYAKVNVVAKNKLLSDTELDVWMSHGDQVSDLPRGFSTIASTKTCPHAAVADEAKQFYGVQFHPEVTHTQKGKEIFAQFIKTICACQCDWTPEQIIEEQIALIKAEVGDENVLLGLSGGVDSSVLAALTHKAIGDQLTCVFVDTGLLRLNEVEEVKHIFSDHFGVKLICVDAKSLFLSALKGVTDPEKKRKVIGELFIRVFESEAKKLKNIQWLAQGTIYPDVIESAKTKSGKGQVIKSHHNVGGLPEKMHLKLLEPLRELFKDEVRKLGTTLGLPDELVYRHPFPGPGLALRVIDEVTEENVAILQRADAIFIEALRENNLYDAVSQAFAVFLPVKSVAVKGDARHYGYVIALRAVKSIDFMTAEWADLPHQFLAEVSLRIVNEMNEISRVVYDISGKPPATIEWE